MTEAYSELRPSQQYLLRLVLTNLKAAFNPARYLIRRWSSHGKIYIPRQRSSRTMSPPSTLFSHHSTHHLFRIINKISPLGIFVAYRAILSSLAESSRTLMHLLTPVSDSTFTTTLRFLSKIALSFQDRTLLCSSSINMIFITGTVNLSGIARRRPAQSYN
jgi:hypothetical protein